jgi:hypothetical protein
MLLLSHPLDSLDERVRAHGNFTAVAVEIHGIRNRAQKAYVVVEAVRRNAGAGEGGKVKTMSNDEEYRAHRKMVSRVFS